MKKIDRSNWVKYFSVLVSLEGLVALMGLLSLKSMPGNVFLFGFSKQRLFILFVFGSMLISIWFFSFKLLKNEDFKTKVHNVLNKKFQLSRVYYLFLILCFIGAIALLLGINVLYESTNAVYQSYFERIKPILWFFTVLFIEMLLFARLLKQGLTIRSFPISIAKKFLILLLISAMIFGFVIFTRIGLVPDEFQWRGPGTPLLFFQVFFSVLLGFFLSKIGNLILSKVKGSGNFSWLTVSKLDLFLMVAFWVVALFFWKSEGLQTNYFNPGVTPPNFEFYPYSDAAGFDISSYQLLIGNGFESDVRRPLLSAFLALGHGLFGYSYESIINWQLFFYSSLPVFLYILVKILHNRVSAVMIATLVIFREIISIKLSGWIYVSNTKMIMSDFPTLLGVILIVYFLSKWLIREDKSEILLFIAGGILGFTMLIRLQVVVILFAIIIFILIKLRSQIKKIGINLAALLVGLMIVILPWMTRNYIVTGSFNFTDFSSSSQGGLISARYDLESVDRSEDSGSLLEKVIDEPGEVANFVGTHFIHNQLNALLVLPIDSFLIENINSFLNTHEYFDSSTKYFINMFSARNYAESLPYWPEWQDEYSLKYMIPLTTNLLIVLLGISVAWRKNGLAGIFPLFAYFSYVLGISIFRISGWRFIMPVDWVVILYYGIGLIQLVLWITRYFKNEPLELKMLRNDELIEDGNDHSKMQWATVAALFFLVSISIPMAEIVIPSRYSSGDMQMVLEEKSNFLFPDDPEEELGDYLAQKNAVVIQGLALYPRFDMANEGHSGSQWESHIPQKFSRLGFLVAEDYETVLHVILPIDKSPNMFPNGSDVIVLACKKEGYLVANAVIYGQIDMEEIMFSSQLDWRCN